VVFGEVNYTVLEDLVSLCFQLAVYRHGPAATCASSGSTISSGSTTSSGSAAAGSGVSGLAGLLGLAEAGTSSGSREAVPVAGVPGAVQVPPGLMSRAALERAIIGKAVALVSGPGGLAGFLRPGAARRTVSRTSGAIDNDHPLANEQISVLPQIQVRPAPESIHREIVLADHPA
jgi:hypothetical protein